MNVTKQKRSGMLSTIYNMLPGIDNDYAAKLVYMLENKKTVAQLQQDIADLAAQLNSDSPMTDTMIAKMLLDECTLSAALRQLRIYNNSTSITELCAALNLPATDTSKLLEIYASFSSHLYFDEAFENALKATAQATQNDEEKVRGAVQYLLQQAEASYENARERVAQNKTDIFTTADRYHLPVKLTAQLEVLYSQPASIAFQPAFDNLYQQILLQNDNKPLAASLAARVLLYQLTPKDAQQTALASKLLGNQLVEEDLLVIACRYLKLKTPQDIAAAFEGVLSKLPYVDNPQENLGLAVRVLVDGTPDSFSAALQQAAFKRDREILRRELSKHTRYDNYAYELSRVFGGKKDFNQLEQEMEHLLTQLPYCVHAEENKELACKVLLGSLNLEEATRQATYMNDLKASQITHRLLPGILKMYRGTQSAEQVTQFLDKTIEKYTFWKANREKHIFALHVLIETLNGTYDTPVSTAVLEGLEQQVPVHTLEQMLVSVKQQNLPPQERAALLACYTAKNITDNPV